MFSSDRAGVYDVLSEMEKMSAEKSLKTNKQEILSARVLHLKKRRDELRNKLEQDNEVGNNLGSRLAKKLMEAQWIYRLLGISVVVLDEKALHVTFITSYRGTYCESYAAVLKEKSDEENKFLLVRHDFPRSLPSDDLSVWLGNGLQEFVSQVNHRLHVFITRREELNMVKANFKEHLLEEFVTFLDLSYIKFALNQRNRLSGTSSYLEVSLTYGDPLLILPSAVHLNPSDTSAFDAGLLSECKEIFRMKRLSDAVTAVIDLLST